MYSFVPRPDLSGEHFGFYFICLILLAVWFAIVLDDGVHIITKSIWSCIFGCLVYFGYTISYTPMHPVNELVIGHFIQFQPEAYKAREGNHDTDHHDMYVVYEVNGSRIIFPASTGNVYPQSVNLYRN